MQEAMQLITERGLTSVAVGLLRQELDSLVRVLFLLAQSDRALRSSLVSAAISGERWRVPTPVGGSALVTDRDLIEAADRYTGWSRRVYLFGSSFIHLSDRHDHQARDPFKALPVEERDVIVEQLNHYHGAALTAESGFDEVAALVPRVLNKISCSLENNLNRLEHGHDLAP